MLNNSHWHGNREGTNPPVPIPGSISNGKGINSTENPREGATEVWEVGNITEDAHPIHVHMIQFQVIGRQLFDAEAYTAAWEAAFPGGVFLPGYGPPLSYNTPNAEGAFGGNLPFGPYLQGAVSPPEPNEVGWKDTMIMYPGTVTRIVIRWAPQRFGVNQVSAGQNLFPFDPTGGPGSIWHCHILDHEDNEMMRPLLIQK